METSLRAGHGDTLWGDKELPTTATKSFENDDIIIVTSYSNFRPMGGSVKFQGPISGKQP